MATPEYDDVSFLGAAKDIQIGDIKYNYHRFGKTDGGKPALVLIQGLGVPQLNWPMVMLQEVSKSREVVIFDNALAGVSVDTKAGERPLDLTIPFMAQSTVDFIAGLKLGAAPDVMGMSLGGMVALYIAAHHGAAIHSVVAAGTSYGGKDAPQPEGGISAKLDYLKSEASANDLSVFLPLADKDPGFTTLARHIVTMQMAAMPGFMGAPTAGYAYAKGIIPPTADAMTVSQDTKAKQVSAVKAFFEGPGLLPKLADSRKKIMWMTGSKDGIFPADTAVKGAAAVPGSKLVQIPNAGHALYLQDPKSFTQELLNFLA